MPYVPTYGYFLGATGTEQMLSANDATCQFTYEDNVREAKTLAGTLTRDYPALDKIRHWRWQYNGLAGKRRDVYDGGMGRNDLKALYDNQKNVPAFYNLYEPTDSLGQQIYVVTFVLSSWQDEVIFRTPHADNWLYRVAFELVQVS